MQNNRIYMCVCSFFTEFTDNLLASQAFVFFVAGFETSSTTLSFCLHELAVNPDIQDKLRDSIKLTLKKYDGKITYESLQNMPYLDQVVDGMYSLIMFV